ncbi:hypothetical protein BS47DRAFT_1394863 [Hydnum rufescens UP504]|uniref:Uncharacterized protein n=1 Tax=Hydnum rufescens UP504 TaxID=1448309 RepID=A0A9P6ATP3_9AGAM|nr:hypothetical protein BS47DRAFT_1394863 [Hydnum rufescens UP504]
MPYLNLMHEVRVDSRPLHDMDNHFASPLSLPPPPFRMTEANRYIVFFWHIYRIYIHGAHWEILFQVSLSCFCRSATYPNPVAIPWDARSKDISGGRFSGAHGTTTPGLSIDDDLLLHIIESDIFPFGECIVDWAWSDEEHIIIWAHTEGSGPALEYKSHKLIILSF